MQMVDQFQWPLVHALGSGTFTIPNRRRSNGWIFEWPSSMVLGLILLLLTLNLSLTFGRPVHNSHRHGHERPGGVFNGASEKSQMDGTTYLMKYGYLPGSDMETGALRTDEELQRAVRHFQKFAHIPETGRLDAQTVEAMGKPRCGMADLIQGHGHHRDTDGKSSPPSGYTLGPSKWQKSWLTVRILNFSPDLRYDETRDAFIRALYVWSDVAQLSFHEVQSGHADIYIQFSSGYHQDGYPFDGPGMVLAHAFFPGDERGGDIHFDDDEVWTVRSETGVNLFMVAAHELGHSLGLAHSNVPGSLMYPWHQGYTPDFRLHPDDITAIQYLYGPKIPRRHPPPPTQYPRTAQPPTPYPRPTTPYPRPTTPYPRPTTHRPPPPPRPTQPSVPTSTQRISSSTSSYHTPSRSTPSSTKSTSSTTRSTTSSTSPAVPTSRPSVNGSGGRVTDRSSVVGSVPDPCSAIDALSVVRGETFIFSGKWVWRTVDGKLMEGFPVEITRFWYGLPKDLERVDALFERSIDGKIIFFIGNRYWELSGNHLSSYFPREGRPISDFGLPEDIDHIDAAFVWGHNRRTYLITGHMYWKLNETGHGIETYSYPRDMSMWGGVPVPVDSAFTYTDGHTYFFKGSSYWEFNNARMYVRHHHPKKTIGDKWLKCETPTVQVEFEVTERLSAPSPPKSTAPTIQITRLFNAVTLLLILSFLSSAVAN